MAPMFIALVLMLASIFVVPVPLARAAQAASSPPAVESLAGTAWRAIELSGTTVSALPEAREPHLVFDVSGRVSGADGCNRIGGRYTQQGNALTFSGVMGTRMACPDTQDLSRRFQNALTGTSHLSVVEGRLQLLGATGKPLAVFERRAR